MTNSVMLRKKIDEAGYKLAFVAAKCGLTYQGFVNKVDNKTEFTMSEACTLRELLSLDADDFNTIFFMGQS